MSSGRRCDMMTVVPHSPNLLSWIHGQGHPSLLCQQNGRRTLVSWCHGRTTPADMA